MCAKSICWSTVRATWMLHCAVGVCAAVSSLPCGEEDQDVHAPAGARRELYLSLIRGMLAGALWFSVQLTKGCRG